MPNCKPGDLAIIVASDRKKNIGKIVRVIRLRGERERIGTFWKTPGAVSWIVESMGGPLTAMNNRFGERGAFKVRPYLDSCLRPIRPDSLDEEQTRHVDRTIKA